MEDLLTPAEEKRFLLGLLEQLDHPRQPRRLGLFAKLGLWLLFVILGIVILQVFGRPTTEVLGIAVGGVAVGAIAAFAATSNVFGRHLLVAGQFVDRQRVEARLRQLGV